VHKLYCIDFVVSRVECAFFVIRILFGTFVLTERMDDESSDSGTEVDPRPSSHIHTITGTGFVYVCTARVSS